MEKLRNYDIAFSGLKNGKHHFQFEIDKEFFRLFDVEQEFSNPKINVSVLLNKHTTFLEFHIKVEGNVELICDISTENYLHPITNELEVLVKFGEQYDDSDSGIIVIPHQHSAFNVAQLIYEEVALSIPMKKICPNLSEDNLRLLEKFMPKTTDENEPTILEEEDKNEIDPRWNALKNLKKEE